jgi:hypothetical protein
MREEKLGGAPRVELRRFPGGNDGHAGRLRAVSGRCGRGRQIARATMSRQARGADGTFELGSRSSRKRFRRGGSGRRWWQHRRPRAALDSVATTECVLSVTRQWSGPFGGRSVADRSTPAVGRKVRDRYVTVGDMSARPFLALVALGRVSRDPARAVDQVAAPRGPFGPRSEAARWAALRQCLERGVCGLGGDIEAASEVAFGGPHPQQLV